MISFCRCIHELPVDPFEDRLNSPVWIDWYCNLRGSHSISFASLIDLSVCLSLFFESALIAHLEQLRGDDVKISIENGRCRMSRTMLKFQYWSSDNFNLSIGIHVQSSSYFYSRAASSWSNETHISLLVVYAPTMYLTFKIVKFIPLNLSWNLT